jgi:mycofactocin precursor
MLTTDNKQRTRRKKGNRGKMEDKEKEEEKPERESEEEAVFSVKEITIEEMAIDGICGVY